MVDTNDDLNNDENHGQQPAADAIIADSDSDSDEDEDSADDDEEEESDSDDESAVSVVAADTMLVRASRRAKLMSLLEQYEDCPFHTRNNVDELVEELLEKAEDDVHRMLCDQNIDPELYEGLDFNRDTIKEVRTIVQLFPNTLSKRKDEDDGEGSYPIQCLVELCGPNGYSFNFKATPFIATLALLATDSDQFKEEERGGLLIEDRYGYNTLQYLAFISHSSDEGELNQRTDTVCLTQFIQLLRMDFFIQEDILKYNLVNNVCYQDYFAENTFQFLVEWYPSSLVHLDEEGSSPLHCVAQKSTSEGFRSVFQYVIRYYPTKKGISSLFTKSSAGETAFQIACQKYGREVVMRIVRNTLNNSVRPLHIVEAVVMAAMDGTVHLDCVYFLLRREPHVWVRLLSEPYNNNNNDDADGGGNYNNGHDDVDDNDDNGDSDGDSDNDSDGGIVDSKNSGAGTRKRKRNV